VVPALALRPAHVGRSARAPERDATAHRPGAAKSHDRSGRQRPVNRTRAILAFDGQAMAALKSWRLLPKMHCSASPASLIGSRHPGLTSHRKIRLEKLGKAE
jgi:hypothetical protein